MKKRILLAITTVTLLTTGCADKKITTIDPDINGANSEVYSGDGTQIYNNRGDLYGNGVGNNVDPYGSGNYGNSGTYTDGSYGGENGNYGDGGVSNIYFDVDQYIITSEHLPTIHRNATLLKQEISHGSKLKIEGHCDASGSDEYNYALGLRRAKAAKDAMINKGINADSILMISMGESTPECTESSSSDCYAKNRRVEFKVAR